MSVNPAKCKLHVAFFLPHAWSRAWSIVGAHFMNE